MLEPPSPLDIVWSNVIRPSAIVCLMSEAFKKQVMHDRKSNFRNGQLVPMDRALSHLQTNVGSLLFWHKNRTTSYQKKRQIPIETTEERGLTVSREKVSHPMMDLYRGSSYNAILSNADISLQRGFWWKIFSSQYWRGFLQNPWMITWFFGRTL